MKEFKNWIQNDAKKLSLLLDSLLEIVSTFSKKLEVMGNERPNKEQQFFNPVTQRPQKGSSLRFTPSMSELL